MLRVSQAIKDAQDKGAQKNKGPSKANNASRQQEQPSSLTTPGVIKMFSESDAFKKKQWKSIVVPRSY
jgi:hypothetical protein